MAKARNEPSSLIGSDLKHTWLEQGEVKSTSRRHLIMHAFLKLVAGLILMGSVGSLEIDRIGFTQYFVQCALGLALWIVAEQGQTIRRLQKLQRRQR